MNLIRLEQILARFSQVRLVVFGDYFLDNYLMLDRALSETSLETGLEAYQVVESRAYPGAAGTVAANLRALGVQVLALGLYGDDGHGHELHKKLVENGVDLRGLIEVPGYATPTYTKPMMREPDGRVHELNRMDIKHRDRLAAHLEEQLSQRLELLLAEADGMLVIDQVSERNCGVITDRLREEIRRQAEAHPDKIILADSRDYLSLFNSVILKANLSESVRAAGEPPAGMESQPDRSAAEHSGKILSARTGCPVVITLGSEGLMLIPSQNQPAIHIPAVPVSGPIDIVGAGDSVNASIGAALCAGAALEEAGLIGSLVASIVIQQIGVTGTASPQQVINRYLSLKEPR